MFGDIEKKLEAYSIGHRQAIIREWRRLILPELKSLSKRLNPFEGKGKPKPASIFGAQPARRKGAITIWGVHPNVAADPVHYPRIPAEGFYKTKPFPVAFPGGAFRSVSKGQAHMERIPQSIYNTSTNLHEFFTLRGRVYGIDKLSGHVIPAYSERSLPEMVMDYEGLEELILKTFEEAVKVVK